MSKIAFLLDELRRLKLVGRTDDRSTADIMYQSSDTLLLRYFAKSCSFASWVVIRRSSRQYYKVVALIETMFSKQEFAVAFRNYRLTADYIKHLFRR